MAFVPGIRSEEQLQGIWESLLGGIALPSGGATSANQTTEITSLQLIDDLVLAQSVTLGSNKGLMVMGAVTAGDPTYTDGNINPISLTTAGALRTFDSLSFLQLVDVNSHLTNIEFYSTYLAGISGNQTLLGTTPHVNNQIFGRGVPAMAQLDDTSTATVTENNVGLLRINSSRALHTEIREGSVQVPMKTYLGALYDSIVTQGTANSSKVVVVGGIDKSGTGNDEKLELVSISHGGPTFAAVVSLWNSTSGNEFDPSLLSTAAAQATQLTALQLIDDIPHAANATLSKGVPIMGQLDDTSTATVTENNVGMARITGARALHQNLRNNSGSEIGIQASPVFVRHTDGTNNMPTGDAIGRYIYTVTGDGSGFFNLTSTVASIGGFGAQAVLYVDSSFESLDFTANGELRAHVASTDNTKANGRYLLADANGALATYSNGSNKASYSVSTTALAPAATATDIWEITGSGTKTIKITQLWVSGTAATAINTPILLIKRSTANSGGTSSATTFVPHDSSNSAATATGKAYTANPTTGTAVGTIRTISTFFSLATASGTTATWDFGVRPSQPIVLRGTSQQLCVNLNSATVLTGSLNIWAEITEE